MWQAQGDTAVLTIQGSLINGKAGYMRLFGVVGYEDITEALGEAVAAKNVKRIVLLVDSGGGSVNGVEDAGNFIRKTSAVKPVIAYTDGGMMSAAYWLGSSADKVYASRMAQIGSVGTLIVHTEYSKQLAEAGVNKTLVRYGKYKALGNPYEPLSDDAKEQLQAMADESGRIFVEYVSDRRKVTAEKFQKTMGEGRVFMGGPAKEVGLIDAVMSLDELVVHAKSLDKPETHPQNSRHSFQGNPMKLRALSLAVLVALAGGTKVEALGLSSPTANAEGTAPEAEDVTALTADATAIQAAFTASTDAAVKAAVAAAKAEADTALAALTAANAALTAKATLLEAGATELAAKVTASNELAASCAGIIKSSMSVMSVALGGAADVGASLTGPALIAEHDKLAAQFKTKFQVGGVAAVTGVPKPAETATASPPLHFLSLLPQKSAA
jgi:signal peptide peptidase SppA